MCLTQFCKFKIIIFLLYARKKEVWELTMNFDLTKAVLGAL